jgi:hypothetical protein
MSEATTPPPSSSSPPHGAWIEELFLLIILSAAVAALSARWAPVIVDDLARFAISTGGPIRASGF